MGRPDDDVIAAEGAAVMLAARGTDALERSVKEIRADGGVADAVTLDLADRATIRAAVDRVEELHGRARPAGCHERRGRRRAVRRQLRTGPP